MPTQFQYTRGRGSDLHLKVGSDYVEIPGFSDQSGAGGGAPTADVETSAGTYRIPGDAPPATLTVTVAAAALAHRSTKLLNDALRNGTPVTLRQRTPVGSEVSASQVGRTAAIATTGVVTFASPVEPEELKADGTGEWKVGMVLQIGNAVYVIDSIPADGDATVFPAPSQAVAAAAYSVRIPRFEREYLCNVSDALQTNYNIPSGTGVINGAFVLEPVTSPPDWTATAG